MAQCEGKISLIETDSEIQCDIFQYYRCILLVPDIYNRQHVKEVVNMLLLNMGFSGASLLFRDIDLNLNIETITIKRGANVFLLQA